MTVELHLDDCLEYMKTMPAGSVDAVITDPPYGIGKAEWDSAFPVKWYFYARRIAQTVIIITGGAQLKYTIPLVGNDFIDVICARNLNGMTFSPLGFGNYLAAVVAGKRPRAGVTFFEFSVRGDMPDHPSPKPIEYMQKLIERVTQEGDTIFDPFMGSGTTGVACVQLGRNFIGCEIDPKYFDIAKKRIAQAELQPQLFKERVVSETQEELL
jgi:site-specific DNA-methyltransferase (adenine-specific)